MLREGFREMVVKIWNDHYEGSHIEQWQQNLRVLRRNIRGWNINANAWYRKIKKEIFGKLDVIDKCAEVNGLNDVIRTEQIELRA